MDFFNYLKNAFAILADLFGIVGFFLTILTYLNTKKLKSSDDRVSFRLKKEEILSDFQKNLHIIRGYKSRNDIKCKDLQPIIQAIEEVIASVKSLNQYKIWDAAAKVIFSDLTTTDIQIRKIKAAAQANPGERYTGHTPEDISAVFNTIGDQLEKIIHIVEIKA